MPEIWTLWIDGSLGSLLTKPSVSDDLVDSVKALVVSVKNENVLVNIDVHQCKNWRTLTCNAMNALKRLHNVFVWRMNKTIIL